MKFNSLEPRKSLIGKQAILECQLGVVNAMLKETKKRRSMSETEMIEASKEFAEQNKQTGVGETDPAVIFNGWKQDLIEQLKEMEYAKSR